MRADKVPNVYKNEFDCFLADSGEDEIRKMLHLSE